MRTIIWLGVCAVAAACGSTPSAPAHPNKPPPGITPDAGVASATAPSTKECEQLIAHVVDLSVAEHAAEPPPSETERKAMGQPLATFATECGSLTRESYRCGMDATTIAAVTACHATRSSSTSNSSVAPGGIKPPAPRSP